MKKFFRRALTAIFVFAFMISADVVGAEVKTYTGVGEYYMSDFETPEIAKQRAKQRAERNACEKAGVYVKSFSRTINLELDEDVIETMTSGILKIVDVQYHRENSDNDTTLFRVTIQAQIDDADIKNWLKKDSQEISTLVSQNEALRKSNEELARQIDELKKKIPQAKTEADKERITQEFAAEDKKFLSNQKVDEGLKLWERKDFNGAKNLFDEAIQLNSNNAQAWFGRGTAYDDLNQYEKALTDLNKAISLDPKNAMAYNNRGVAYELLGKHELAIQDYDKAIEINQNYADAYSNRGISYRNLGKHDQAIQDYDKAIQLNPNLANAYNNRGDYYFNIGKYEKAIQDFTKAIQLKPNYVRAYNNRGICYQILGENAKAQADFNKARELGYKG